MTIFALGPEGTFSHEIAVRLFRDDIILLPTIHQIFQAVEKGDGDGIVPLENSEAGGVGPTLDGLQAHRVFITAEAYMPVHHHLVACEPPADLKVIFVHPQTHEQCSEVIEALGTEVIHTSSNAASAREAKNTPHAGAVVSEMAAAMYGIPIVMAHIENNPGNTTRFVVIGREASDGEETAKCSILVDPETDRAGLLHEILSVFARRKINLTRIESRPSKRGMGSYVFFVDFVPGSDTGDAVAELRTLTGMKHLGCYPRREVPGWR